MRATSPGHLIPNMRESIKTPTPIDEETIAAPNT